MSTSQVEAAALSSIPSQVSSAASDLDILIVTSTKNPGSQQAYLWDGENLMKKEELLKQLPAPMAFKGENQDIVNEGREETEESYRDTTLPPLAPLFKRRSEIKEMVEQAPTLIKSMISVVSSVDSASKEVNEEDTKGDDNAEDDKAEDDVTKDHLVLEATETEQQVSEETRDQAPDESDMTNDSSFPSPQPEAPSFQPTMSDLSGSMLTGMKRQSSSVSVDTTTSSVVELKMKREISSETSIQTTPPSHEPESTEEPKQDAIVAVEERLVQEGYDVLGKSTIDRHSQQEVLASKRKEATSIWKRARQPLKKEAAHVDTTVAVTVDADKVKGDKEKKTRMSGLKGLFSKKNKANVKSDDPSLSAVVEEELSEKTIEENTPEANINKDEPEVLEQDLKKTTEDIASDAEDTKDDKDEPQQETVMETVPKEEPAVLDAFIDAPSSPDQIPIEEEIAQNNDDTQLAIELVALMDDAEPYSLSSDTGDADKLTTQSDPVPPEAKEIKSDTDLLKDTREAAAEPRAPSLISPTSPTSAIIEALAKKQAAIESVLVQTVDQFSEKAAAISLCGVVNMHWKDKKKVPNGEDTDAVTCTKTVHHSPNADDSVPFDEQPFKEYNEGAPIQATPNPFGWLFNAKKAVKARMACGAFSNELEIEDGADTSINPDAMVAEKSEVPSDKMIEDTTMTTTDKEASLASLSKSSEAMTSDMETKTDHMLASTRTLREADVQEKAEEVTCFTIFLPEQSPFDSILNMFKGTVNVEKHTPSLLNLSNKEIALGISSPRADEEKAKVEAISIRVSTASKGDKMDENFEDEEVTDSTGSTQPREDMSSLLEVPSMCDSAPAEMELGTEEPKDGTDETSSVGTSTFLLSVDDTTVEIAEENGADMSQGAESEEIKKESADARTVVPTVSRAKASVMPKRKGLLPRLSRKLPGKASASPKLVDKLRRTKMGRAKRKDCKQDVS